MPRSFHEVARLVRKIIVDQLKGHPSQADSCWTWLLRRHASDGASPRSIKVSATLDAQVLHLVELCSAGYTLRRCFWCLEGFWLRTTDATRRRNPHFCPKCAKHRYESSPQGQAEHATRVAYLRWVDKHKGRKDSRWWVPYETWRKSYVPKSRGGRKGEGAEPLC
jgi:hypothetical protein